MRGHRALRESGRAAGVEDGGRGRPRRPGPRPTAVAVGQRVAGRDHYRGAAVGRRRTPPPRRLKRVFTGTTTAPASERPEEREHPVDAVAEPDRDAVAGLHAGRAQPAGDPRGAVPQLAIASAALRRRSRPQPVGRRRARPSRGASPPATWGGWCSARPRRSHVPDRRCRTGCARGVPVRQPSPESLAS